MVALHDTAKTCAFGAMTEELIRDVVVEKTVDPRLRERFLLDNDLTLEKVLQMAEAIECSLREAAAIAPSASQLGASSKVSTTTNRHTPQSPSPSPATQCTHCGRRNHQASNKSCPARKIVCHQCRRKGQFASWFHRKEKPPVRVAHTTGQTSPHATVAESYVLSQATARWHPFPSSELIQSPLSHLIQSPLPTPAVSAAAVPTPAVMK